MNQSNEAARAWWRAVAEAARLSRERRAQRQEREEQERQPAGEVVPAA